MAERKAVNKYYPPEWTPDKGSINKFKGTHALRERARKLHMGILIIRFEMPFNIWCNGCENHIGMGVRYNAEKTKVGMYYTTPIYKFRMKCHLCNNHFEIQTDPQNLDYVILDGARRQERRWDPTQNEQVVPEDKEVSKKLSTDSMFCLEHNVNDKIKQKTILPSLQKLEESKEKWKDDYLLNKALRQQFREKKKEISTIEDKDKQLLKKCSLDIALLPETDEDRRLAGLLKLAPLYSFEEKKKLKREESLSRPLFPNSSNMPTLANSIRESKIKTLLKPLNKSELGISVKICKEDTMKSEKARTSKSVKTNDVKTSLVAFDYDSSDSDEEKT
ncbi:coiled-coil domain-containing protein 130 homolog [Trichonephila clavata]|uniref:Coiled-coil domain-containing protein 130 homolog n=2 Tax=Trichonephila clavata TaxID=2740835 RepID=A0A8X6LUS9_TRICU|nr:coiled-coil domain-containing protein 130 homolog [Trichonephila clavata]